MYKMKIVQFNVALLTSLFMILLIVTGCDSINNQVEDAMEDDEYEMEVVDQLASILLGDSAIIDLKFKTITAASFDTLDTNYVLGLPGGIKDTVSQTNIQSLLDTLEGAKVTVAVFDSAYKYDIPTTPRKSCFCFNSGANEELVFYFTNYVLMNIIDENGASVQLKSNTIPLELIAGCYTLINNKPDPIVKSRYVYELSKNKKYLFQIIRNDQTTPADIYGAILSK